MTVIPSDFSERLKQAPVLHSCWHVKSQDIDSRAAERRLCNQQRTIPFEVLVPVIVAGMKQASYFTRFRINPSQIRTFVNVAIKAGPCQIGEHGFPVMHFRDDMIDLKRQLIRRLWDAAVFTTIAGALANLSSKTLVHAVRQLPFEERASDSRAFA